MLWWGFMLKYLSYGTINKAMPPQWQGFRPFDYEFQSFTLHSKTRALYSLLVLQKLHHNWDCVCNPFSLRLREQPFLGGGKNKITVDVGEHLTPNHLKNFSIVFICMLLILTYVLPWLLQLEYCPHYTIHIIYLDGTKSYVNGLALEGGP